jgi:glutaconyl-CoA decarboxylase
LPGSVVSISVKAGDAVKAGQQLAVIEAMKMENEILAPADGTIKADHVSAGQAVQQGDALIDLA